MEIQSQQGEREGGRREGERGEVRWWEGAREEVVAGSNDSCIYGIDVVDYSLPKTLLFATSKTSSCQNTTLNIN